MDNNRKTALYVRVSTDSQFEEGYSVEAQTEKLEVEGVIMYPSDYYWLTNKIKPAKA